MDQSINADVLESLLAEAGKYHPHYGDRLAMHLPMTLIALDKLGASSNKLEQIFNNGIDQLVLIQPITNIPEAFDFVASLGDSTKYTTYLAYFHRKLTTETAEAVVKDALPYLIPGLSASAFHAMIRLAYAIEIQNIDEVAIALAYWSAEYQAFELNQQQTNNTLAEVLRSVADKGVHFEFAPGIIVDRMNEIGELLKSDQSLVQPESISLEEVRRLALTAFFAEDDFTLLHTVTGCYAFSKILPFINDKEWAIRELWQAIVIAYLSTGLPFEPKRLPQETMSEGDFEPLKVLALQSEDSHEIKLFYTCYCEYKTHKEPGYFWLAKRIFS